jgi:hypothetical protein
MLTMSDRDYRELRRIKRLREGGKISKAEFGKSMEEIIAPLEREEELRKEKEKVRNEKAKLRRDFRQKLSSIDSLYNGKRGGPAVQGGLPSLGKRR